MHEFAPAEPYCLYLYFLKNKCYLKNKNNNKKVFDIMHDILFVCNYIQLIRNL